MIRVSHRCRLFVKRCRGAANDQIARLANGRKMVTP